MLVVDANILIRAVLGRQVRTLLTNYADKITLLAPDFAYREARDRTPQILDRRAASIEPAMRYLESLPVMVQSVDLAAYTAFEEAARLRLRGRDEKDWPILAVALAYAFPIWTEDFDFFGTGVATWTTSRIEILVREASAAANEAAAAE